MKSTLLLSVSLLSSLQVSSAGPVKPRDVFTYNLGGSNRLVGTSFGAPGDQTFDYVIVGGGTAGLALAKRLAEKPEWSVAVIEAGGFYEFGNGNVSQVALFASAGTDKSTTNYNPVIDWGFVTQPQAGVNNVKIHYARGKCLGGTSARNYMAYQRGSKKTYDLWASQVGDQDYSWSSFLPFLQKSVHFNPPDSSKRASNATPSYDGPLISTSTNNGPVSLTFSNYAMAMSSWIQKGLQEIGISPRQGFTSGSLFGSSYVLESINDKTQIRESSETSFLQEAFKTVNSLVIFKQSLAKKVKFDASKRATGVVVETAGRQYTLSARREVILSAGAFQSPQLLMVSGVGPAATLNSLGIPIVKELPGVGQNLWDHIFFGPSYRVNVISGSSLGNPGFAAKAVDDLLKKQSGILTNSGGDLFAFEKVPASLRAGFSNATKDALQVFPDDWPEVEYLSVGGYMGDNVNSALSAPTDSYNYISVVASLVAPLSRGTVSISSADTADPPLIDPRWLTDPTDQAVAIAGYKRLRQLFATNALKPVLIGPEYYPGASVGSSDQQLLAEIKKGFQTIWHAACTCKMGKSTDPLAVVDSQARVFGVKGLRVVDASAFALLPAGHPMSTVYGLAEKIANDIKTKPLNF